MVLNDELFKLIETNSSLKYYVSDPLQYGEYYYIYNREVNGETLFHNNDNYEHFLRLYEKYMEVVVDTYACCLLENHFHLLVCVKEEEEIGYMPSKNESSFKLTPQSGQKATDRVYKKHKPSSQFSHLFNSYAQAFNKQTKRHGSLFESPFKRILVDSDSYFQTLICYIHNNPIHHGFTSNAIDYPWSSYHTAISMKPTKLKRSELMEWFGSTGNFVKYHQQKQDYITIEKLIIE